MTWAEQTTGGWPVVQRQTMPEGSKKRRHSQAMAQRPSLGSKQDAIRRGCGDIRSRGSGVGGVSAMFGLEVEPVHCERSRDYLNAKSR